MQKQNKQKMLEAQNLTDKQFAALKEYYVDQNMFIRKWAAMKNFFPVVVLYTKFQL